MSTFGVLAEGNEFWEHLNEGEFYIQHCTSCNEYIFYPRPFCPHDFGELTYVKASGKGKVLTYSVVVSTPDPRLKDKTPAIVGVVKLAEGPTMYAQIEADITENLNLFDAPVEVFIDEFGGKKIPKFKVTT